MIAEAAVDAPVPMPAGHRAVTRRAWRAALAAVLAVGLCAPPARAQQTENAAPPGPLASEQAQLQKQNAILVQAAGQVADLVDQNRAAEVWAGASAAVKALVKDAQFLQQVAADRARLGAVVKRDQVGIGRAFYPPGGPVPPGSYVTVVYSTRFADAPRPVREIVSFRLDDDRTWRVSGYSVR